MPVRFCCGKMILRLVYTKGNDMIKCNACGLVYDPKTTVDADDCPQCQLKEVLASKGMEISALKNQVFKLKLKLGEGKK
jgi:Zn finger protein HypA/HybF involved in hydrogenase expression